MLRYATHKKEREAALKSTKRYLTFSVTQIQDLLNSDHSGFLSGFQREHLHAISAKARAAIEMVDQFGRYNATQKKSHDE